MFLLTHPIVAKRPKFANLDGKRESEIKCQDYICPHCGGVFPADETCQERFDSCMLKEVENPAYYAVHHLSVACYMLQHNAYSRQGWLTTRELLRQFVNEGLTPAAARPQNWKKLDNGQRSWSITKGSKLTQVDDIIWSYTIADVRLESADLYCADVRIWAKWLLADTDRLALT